MRRAPKKILPVCNVKNPQYWIWKDIRRPLDVQRYPNHPFTSNLILQVGDGKTLDFWDDSWVQNNQLKKIFPRIFALSVKKSGKISKFGLWEGIVWRWHIPLRRPLFDWEIDQLNDFLSMLAEVKLGSLPYDRLCWVKASTGCYTTKDMCKLLGKRDQDVFDRNTIWEGLAPFKVECFSWKLLHGRLPTNALLLGVYGAGGVIYGSYNVYFLWNPKPSLPVGLIYAQRVSQYQSGK
ncbi:hypothetical protein V6N11_017714 [Hibiscus sabdariffa]|uniref:Reverse transcriptase zinc-binding domain-containing protein n=1 Tax=Hibiscus sabdariffa TaxID=183260 RepID=A0ABR2TZ40_9ROSI